MTAFIFDLDGTLVDTVYPHVLAWHTALKSCGLDLAMWRIHRKIGMSGGLLMNALENELGRRLEPALAEQLEARHMREMEAMRKSVAPFEGVRDLLATLEANDARYAIASSGSRADTQPLLDMLELSDDVPIITKEDAKNTKPDPQLFQKAAEKLRARSDDCIVVGDSVWDMLASRRAHFLGVGLLTGGYSESEMTAAGAYRVYADPADLHRHLHETGIHIKERASNGTRAV